MKQHITNCHGRYRLKWLSSGSKRMTFIRTIEYYHFYFVKSYFGKIAIRKFCVKELFSDWMSGNIFVSLNGYPAVGNRWPFYQLCANVSCQFYILKSSFGENEIQNFCRIIIQRLSEWKYFLQVITQRGYLVKRHCCLCTVISLETVFLYQTGNSSWDLFFFGSS